MYWARLVMIAIASVASEDFEKLLPSENDFIRDHCGLPGNENLIGTHFKVNPGIPAPRNQFLWTVYLRTTKHKVIQEVDGTILRVIQEADHSNIETHLNPVSIQAFIGSGATGEHAVKLSNLYSEAKNGGELNAFDFAILELVTDINKAQIEEGYVRPICFTNQHWRLLTNRPSTLAGYGDDRDVAEFKGLHYAETRVTTCPATRPVFATVRCYTRVSEHGDSGGPYFRYDTNRRAHLTAISKGNYPGDNVDVAIDAETNTKRGPLNTARRLLDLDYSTRY